jgi:hypothetical protein
MRITVKVSAHRSVVSSSSEMAMRSAAVVLQPLTTSTTSAKAQTLPIWFNPPHPAMRRVFCKERPFSQSTREEIYV